MVAIVGYDSEDGVEYYKMRDSNGTEFGEDRYFRVLRSVAQFVVAMAVSSVEPTRLT